MTHEGTFQVKTSKINLLVHNYELFKMEPSETISAMFSRFTDIINDLNDMLGLKKAFVRASNLLKENTHEDS